MIKNAFLLYASLILFLYSCGSPNKDSTGENPSNNNLKGENMQNEVASDSMVEAIENANKELKESTEKLEKSLEDF